MTHIVIAGAGNGGKLIAQRLSKIVDDDVMISLIGPTDFCNPGLFYFNHPIKGVAEVPVPVSYNKVGEGNARDYQLKSRGFVGESVKVSSFDKIDDPTVIGYLRSEPLDVEVLDNVNRIEKAITDIDLDEQRVYFGGRNIKYDYLISTLPLPVLIKLVVVISTLSKEDFNYKPIYQHQTGEVCSDIDEINVTYDLTDSIYYRHSSYLKNDEVKYIVSESITDFEGKTSTMYPGKIIPSTRVNKFVKDFESDNQTCKLCGRYARWEYHYTVDQSVEDAENFLKIKGLI